MEYKEYQGFLDETADRSVLLSKYQKPLTAALFAERSKVWESVNKEREEESGTGPIYTLGEIEIDGLPSAYQIYMNSVDEYEAAMKLVGSLFHWQELCKTKWFMEAVTQWREHMALRDFSIAKKVVMKEAKGNDGASARKLLDMANKVINPPVKKPTRKEELAAEREAAAQKSGIHIEDLYNKHI